MTGYWTLIDPMSSFLFLKTAEAEDIYRGCEKDVNLFQKGHIIGPCQAKKTKKLPNLLTESPWVHCIIKAWTVKLCSLNNLSELLIS